MYDDLSRDDLLSAYNTMVICRKFENECVEAYKAGDIRGFMHADQGQETVPALIADCLSPNDIKCSFYREHTHALASGVPLVDIMAELFGRTGGTCKGSGGSMHLFDKRTKFQGGWALVGEHLSYAVGMARSIRLDRQQNPAKPRNADKIVVVLLGDGASQTGRMDTALHAAAQHKLPVLFLVVDNGRAINTFTPDVAANVDVYQRGANYGIPGAKVDGQSLVDMLRAGRVVSDYVRKECAPAILQVHTYRFQGHSSADPEREPGRKQEKRWAVHQADPIKLFEEHVSKTSTEIAEADLQASKNRASELVRTAVATAKRSPAPNKCDQDSLRIYPTPVDTDYNSITPPAYAQAINTQTISAQALKEVSERISHLQLMAQESCMTISDALNLAILEEMLDNPRTTMHTEDMSLDLAYDYAYHDMRKLTRRTFGSLRAPDREDKLQDEACIIGQALGLALNGYRPIIELMHANGGIMGMAELSSMCSAHAMSGGQFQMPVSIICAGGVARFMGSAHSTPFHALVMAIPGLKILTASLPDTAYSLTKSMLRDDGPCILFVPEEQMKHTSRAVKVGKCLPLNKCRVLHTASPESVAAGRAVTVITYLHGVRTVMSVISEIQKTLNSDVDLLEMLCLKPVDIAAIRTSIQRTHKVVILDESHYSGGVGTFLSAIIAEEFLSDLDAPVKRLCMPDIPVLYTPSMGFASAVKGDQEVVKAVSELLHYTDGRYK
eukprot:gene9243-10950_t